LVNVQLIRPSQEFRDLIGDIRARYYLLNKKDITFMRITQLIAIKVKAEDIVKEE